MLNIFLLLLISQAQLQAVLSQSTCTVRQTETTTENRCVQFFNKNQTHFDRCKRFPCIIFLPQIPYIVLDKGMTSEDSVRLFHCKDRKKVFPDLHGLSFDIQDQIPPLHEALCIFGGPSCSFEELIQFVRQHHQYQFIAGGYFFTLPHRLTERTRPSSPLLEDKIVIVGLRDSQSPIVRAYTTILRPFQLATWMIILGTALFFILIRIIIAMFYAQSRTPSGLARHIIGDIDSNQVQLFKVQNQESVRLLNRVAVGSLKLAVAAFCAIVILFYEIAVVNFVFFKKTHALQKSLANLSRSEMREYVIPKGGATEVIWRIYADPEGKYRNGTPPWDYCSEHQECVDKILNKSHPAKFSMTYESFVRHALQKRKACDLLTAYETTSPLYAFSAGWYYGAVPLQTQIQIDQAILKLRVHDKIRQLLSREIDSKMPLNCAAMSTNIAPGILGWLLLSVVCVCMVPVIASLIVSSKAKLNDQREKARLERQDEAEGTNG